MNLLPDTAAPVLHVTMLDTNCAECLPGSSVIMHHHAGCWTRFAWTSALPAPGSVWLAAVRCNGTFGLCLSPPLLFPSPALHSFSSALSSLPPSFLCGSSAAAGSHLRPLQAAERNTGEWWEAMMETDQDHLGLKNWHQTRDESTDWDRTAPTHEQVLYVRLRSSD